MSNYGPISQNPHGDFETTCKNCGELFRTDHPEQLYCSNPCKRQTQNRRYYERHQEELRAKALERYHTKD